MDPPVTEARRGGCERHGWEERDQGKAAIINYNPPALTYLAQSLRIIPDLSRSLGLRPPLRQPTTVPGPRRFSQKFRNRCIARQNPESNAA
jgi:hypothetical protein